ncbi:MAG: methyltransferase domain-containing protein [Alphaproteobacteria bacterium]|nr:methyltransferase domain-containing protein [Alphaproteobacteria bacterium]
MSHSNTHTFSGLQDIYDAARPTYPAESLTKLKALINSGSAEIIDIGCGTGILTRQLQAAMPEANIQGCDINADMISKAKQSSSGIKFFENIAEDLPFDDDQFNLITVGQAVHWFDRPKFYPEMMRVLKKGGVLALIENNRSWQTDAFFAKYEDLLEAHSPNYSRHYRDTDYMAEMADAGFKDVTAHESIWQRVMSAAEFTDMSCSSSKMAAARKATDDAVLGELRKLIAEYVDADGKLAIDYVTKIIYGVV